jgi:hypothetical protein
VAELTSGADVVLRRDELPDLDPATWQPRRRPAPIDSASTSAELAVGRLGNAGTVVEAAGEPPLLLLSDSPSFPPLRWSREAVVVAFEPAAAEAALDQMVPRLIALAMTEVAADAAISALRDRLQGVMVIALEPRMAVEV